VELKAWQDLVRVLAHEMMNSLTPICALSEDHRPAPERAGHGRHTDGDHRVGRGESHGAARLDHFVERLPPPHRRPAAVKTRTPAVRHGATTSTGWPPPLIGEDAIDYASTVQPSWLSVDADPDLLEQAAINLLKNAVDAVRGRPAPRCASPSDWRRIR